MSVTTLQPSKKIRLLNFSKKSKSFDQVEVNHLQQSTPKLKRFFSFNKKIHPQHPDSDISSDEKECLAFLKRKCSNRKSVFNLFGKNLSLTNLLAKENENETSTDSISDDLTDNDFIDIDKDVDLELYDENKDLQNHDPLIPELHDDTPDIEDIPPSIDLNNPPIQPIFISSHVRLKEKSRRPLRQLLISKIALTKIYDNLERSEILKLETQLKKHLQTQRLSPSNSINSNFISPKKLGDRQPFNPNKYIPKSCIDHSPNRPSKLNPTIMDEESIPLAFVRQRFLNSSIEAFSNDSLPIPSIF